MKANKDILLSIYSEDNSIIDEFIFVNKDKDYQTIDEMIYDYQDYFEQLNLHYIEDIL